MNTTRMQRRTAGLGARILVGATVLVVFAATPAFADTSQATAQAALLELLGNPIVTTGQRTATNDGSQPAPGTVAGNTTPLLSILGSQTTLAAGALVQQSVANPDGTSAACAGVVGTGGLIQIGAGGDCTIGGSNPTGGVTVNLGTSLVTITADAILAECTADSDGTVTGTATLVNAQVNVLGLPISLPLNPGPNFGVSVTGIASLLLNAQSTPSGPGSIQVSALDLNLLNGTVALTLGTVTCGPNAITPPIPAFPTQGLPIVAATVAAAGAILVVRQRRAAGRKSAASAT